VDRLRHLREQGHRIWHPCKLEKNGGVVGPSYVVSFPAVPFGPAVTGQQMRCN